MNLRAIANGATQTVNPNIIVTLQASNGYTKNAEYVQIPAYLDAVDVYAQLQAMTYKDIQQTANLNIQGVTKSIYLYGSVSGVVRPKVKGGDLITISAPEQDAGTWLVVKVLENWPDWTKAAITLQGGE